MKKADFIKLLKKNNYGPIIVQIPNALSSLHSKIMDIKRIAKYIDFNCQINKDGGCKLHPTSPKCCCSDCRGRIGYLDNVPVEDIGTYARHFNVKTGFWRKTKGCALPHQLRSRTCLSHHCTYEQPHDIEFERAIDTYKNLIFNAEARISNYNRRLKEDILIF